MKVINHIGLSGGKDSTALWGWAINESGYPVESIRGSFSDTENEYQEVYDQIDFLDSYGKSKGVAPIRRLRSEGFLALCLRNISFPSSRRRFCTEELKLFPFFHYVEELQLEGYEVITHSGVRRAESEERKNLEEWGTIAASKRPKFPNLIKVRRPLIDWTLKEVWAAHTRFSLPINPLYFKGRKRVGCRLCCMSSKADIRQTAKHYPETIKEYERWETLVTNANRVSREAKGRHPEMIATFFHGTHIPEAQRSQWITTNDGTRMKIGVLSDVVRWSQTLRGGTQSGFDFMFEEDDWSDFDAAAPCQSGYCE